MMTNTVYKFCFVMCILTPALVLSAEENDHQDGDLQYNIFQNYNRDVRPVADRKFPHYIKAQLYLNSIDDFDMKKQTVKSRMFLELNWKDEFLTWNATSFGNTTRITVDSDLIWIPDLVIGNEEGPFTFISYPMMGKAVIQNDGSVTVWPYLFIEVGSQVEITDYPFDEQSFHFRVSSWGLSTKDLIMELDTYVTSFAYYQESGEWEITRYYAERWNKTIGPDLYSRVAYFVTVKRKSLYFILNVIGPLVVTSLLNTMCFILPVESAQRVTLSVSIFLSLTIFLTIISESLPRTSNGVSVTVIYLCFQVLGSFLTIAMNVIILNIYHRNVSKKKSILLQSMLQLSKNMSLTGWKNNAQEDTVKSNEIKPTQNGIQRRSNGHTIMLDNDEKPNGTVISDISTDISAKSTAPVRKESALVSAIARQSAISDRQPEESDGETKRKVPKIRSRSVKDEETIWTARANILNTCSFWFSVLWNFGLILVLVIIPRV